MSSRTRNSSAGQFVCPPSILFTGLPSIMPSGQWSLVHTAKPAWIQRFIVVSHTVTHRHSHNVASRDHHHRPHRPGCGAVGPVTGHSPNFGFSSILMKCVMISVPSFEAPRHQLNPQLKPPVRNGQSGCHESRCATFSRTVGRNGNRKPCTAPSPLNSTRTQ
jgi:hypothetical protein